VPPPFALTPFLFAAKVLFAVPIATPVTVVVPVEALSISSIVPMMIVGECSRRLKNSQACQ
jgi:hypothetical protein